MLDSPSCVACGKRMAPWLTMPIDAKKNAPTPFSTVVRCQSCGMASLSPIPDASEIGAFYDLPSYYTHGQSHLMPRKNSRAEAVLTKLAWWADKSERFDVDRIAKTLPPNARICDLGCGHANYLRKLKELGFEVIGVEPDEASREIAAAAGVRVLPGTAENVPDDVGGDFDLVLCTHALEHCRDPGRALESAFRITRPGGSCYIEVPNCASEHFRTFTICSEMFDAPRHIHFFTPASLSLLAEQSGFSIIKPLFMGYTRDFNPPWRGWEQEIARRVRQANSALPVENHSFGASVRLFLRSFWRAPERKYDSFGLILRHCKPAPSP